MPLPTSHAQPRTGDMPMSGGARTICSELREVNSNKAGARWGHHAGQPPETQSRAHRGRFGEQPVLACRLGWLLDIQPCSWLPQLSSGTYPAPQARKLPSLIYSQPSRAPLLTGCLLQEWGLVWGWRDGVGQRMEKKVSSVKVPWHEKDTLLL